MYMYVHFMVFLCSAMATRFSNPPTDNVRPPTYVATCVLVAMVQAHLSPNFLLLYIRTLLKIIVGGQAVAYIH